MPSIPRAVREQVWVQRFGKVFEHKCYIKWCTNTLNVYSFHCGHDIPANKGGDISIQNLYPICANCNLGMSDKFTIKQWNSKHSLIKKCRFWFCEKC